MSKFSAGGFIQFPLPSEAITWEEYKAKYGVDLDLIFEITGGTLDEEDYSVLIKRDIDKPMMISGIFELTAYAHREVPPCGYVNTTNLTSTNDASTSYLDLQYYCADGSDNFAYGIRVYANRTIEPFEL